MLKDNISKDTEYLFNRSYDDDLSDEQEDALLDYVSEQINAYGWQDTFNSWVAVSLSQLHYGRVRNELCKPLLVVWWAGSYYP